MPLPCPPVCSPADVERQDFPVLEPRINVSSFRDIADRYRLRLRLRFRPYLLLGGILRRAGTGPSSVPRPTACRAAIDLPGTRGRELLVARPTRPFGSRHRLGRGRAACLAAIDLVRPGGREQLAARPARPSGLPFRLGRGRAARLTAIDLVRAGGGKLPVTAWACLSPGELDAGGCEAAGSAAVFLVPRLGSEPPAALPACPVSFPFLPHSLSE